LQALLTAGGALGSMYLRAQVKTGSITGSSKRSNNLKFVFLTECSGLLAWIGVFTALMHESAHKHLDGDAKGVAALEILQTYVEITFFSNIS
jgi:hypothetical protein